MVGDLGQGSMDRDHCCIEKEAALCGFVHVSPHFGSPEKAGVVPDGVRGVVEGPRTAGVMPPRLRAVEPAGVP